jgi:archaellum component FlaC
MSHLFSKQESTSNEKVEKLKEDIEMLESQVKKAVDLQNVLLEGSSNLESRAKQIEDLAHCLAREIFDFRELAIRLNSTYQILLYQLPKVKISLTLEKFALKQLILEDIALVVPLLGHKDFGMILSLLQVIQNREDHPFTLTNQLQTELERDKILPLSTLRALPQLSADAREVPEHDLRVKQLINE